MNLFAGIQNLISFHRIDRQFNIEVQFVKSVNYTFEQSL